MKGFINKSAIAMLLAFVMVLQTWQLAVPPAAKASGTLPAGWTAKAMNGTATGTAKVTNESVDFTNQVFNMEATGGKQQSGTTEGAGDTVYFAYIPVAGDFTITARVVTATGPAGGSANGETRAMLMVKNGDTNISGSVSFMFKPSVTTISGYRRFAPATGSNSNVNTSTNAPVYLKLEKVGNVFKGSYSTDDGVTYLGSYSQTDSTNSMSASTLNVGLAVTNGSVQFDNVTIVDENGVVFSSTSGPQDPQDPVKPNAPTGLQAIPGDKIVNLSWDTVTGATYYNAKRATISGGPYTTIATNVTSATYLDTSATNGMTYYYVVSAVNDAGEGIHSTEVSAEPAEIPIPIPVSSITVTGGTEITTPGGTLQLQADVQPGNALDKAVDWFVFEADGVTATDKATIDGNGLLQAVKNGSVTVIARAKDGSNVEGSTTISISGQTLPVPAIPEDVDGNKQIDIGDLGIVAGLIGLTSSSPNWEDHQAADVNKDNVIDVLDLQQVANKIE
jgi:hypothetical protein